MSGVQTEQQNNWWQSLDTQAAGAAGTAYIRRGKFTAAIPFVARFQRPVFGGRHILERSVQHCQMETNG